MNFDQEKYEEILGKIEQGIKPFPYETQFKINYEMSHSPRYVQPIITEYNVNLSRNINNIN